MHERGVGGEFVHAAGVVGVSSFREGFFRSVGVEVLGVLEFSRGAVVSALALHTVGALEQVLVVLEVEAMETGDRLVSASGYYVPGARFSSEVDRAVLEAAGVRFLTLG